MGGGGALEVIAFHIAEPDQSVAKARAMADVYHEGVEELVAVDNVVGDEPFTEANAILGCVWFPIDVGRALRKGGGGGFFPMACGMSHGRLSAMGRGCCRGWR